MSLENYIPYSSIAPLDALRDDIKSIVEPLLDKLAYNYDRFSGDETGGYYEVSLTVVDEVAIEIPFTNGIQLVFGGGDLFLQIDIGTNEEEVIGFNAYFTIDFAQIRFPRKWLIPAIKNSNGVYIPDTDTTKSVAIPIPFGISVNQDFEFEPIWPGNIETPLSLIPCMLGDTGFVLGISEIYFDFNRKTSIPQVTAAGFSNDFVGVFVSEVEIGLPTKWNHDAKASTTVIKGKNLLIGTGGISGTIGIESGSGLIKVKFGGFDIELDAFSLTFHKNAITDSTIKGFLTIPKFKDAKGQDAKIAITISFDAKGNFEIMAYEKAGFPITFKMGSDPVFIFTMRELAVGKKDGDYFIETSGTLHFDSSTSIASVLSDDFELNKLRIWDDGKIELDGGTIPLPKGTKIQIGPVKIFITALHFGSTQRGGRKYNYFGFDGGVNINPGGVDARGSGIKFCYTVDSGKFDSYISIDSFNISIIIPGSAKPEEATVIINGWLSVTNETLSIGEGANKKSVDIKVYAGGIDVILPKVKLAAHAAMKYTPDVPAWIVDLGIELPSPIPLGPSGLGIYGFRGLVGQRYVATKHAAGLNEEAKWFDYYKAPPQEGICVQKFEPPLSTKGFSNGFSIGAGVSLATSADGGKAFSSKLFLLLSLPEVIIFEGKANILSERVGLTSQDPPFFAYLAISSESVETGFGLNYKIPKDTGDILDLYVQMEAAFYFHNPKAWYIHFGTPENPITARIISFLNGKSYLMISAMGIEAGASIEFAFKKKYLGGALSAAVEAYIRMNGHISFHRPQIGAHASVGGSVDVRIFGCSFYLGIDCTLGVEVPHPFYVEGSMKLEVRVKILFKKVSKKFTVELRWEKSKDEPNTAILPFEYSSEFKPVKAINIMSNESFDVLYVQETIISSIVEATFAHTIIPMDSYIDIEFLKPVDPQKITTKIGGVGTVGDEYTETIPPKPVKYKSTHSYAVENIAVYIWDANRISDPSTGKWTEYFPYKAMMPPSAIATNAAQLDQLGQWQIQSESVYNRIRLLAQSVFSYMDPGLSGWANPRQYGITPASLFCVGLTPDAQVANWNDSAADTVITKGSLISKNDTNQILDYRLIFGNAIIQHRNNNYNINESLFISNDSRLKLKLPDSSVYVSLKMFTYSKSVEISYYKKQKIGIINKLVLIKKDTHSRYSLLSPIVYKDPLNPVDYIYIEPVHENKSLIKNVQSQIDTLTNSLYESDPQDEASILAEINRLKKLIVDEGNTVYDGDALDLASINSQIAALTLKLNNLLTQRDFELREAARLNLLYDTAKAKMDGCCNTMMSPPQNTERLSCINNLGDIVPDGVSLDEVEFDYDTYINSLQILSNGVVACRSSYVTNIKDVCNFAHLYLKSTKDKANKHSNDAKDKDTEIDKVLEDLQHLSQLQSGSLTEPLPPNVSKNSTIIHQVEWMTWKDYQISQDKAGKAAVEASYQASYQAIEDSLAPVWRPNATYLLSITISDTINKGQNKTAATLNFGFKTARPVGFFHEDYDATKLKKEEMYAPPTKSVPATLPDAPQLNLYKLTTLRDYIDYKRSYPNADGSLINAKPLYYQDTELNLFYIKSYVYHLFSDWPTYGSLTTLSGTLQVIVKDPIEEIELENPLPPTVVSKTIPTTIVGWKKDDNVPAPKSVSVWDIMRNPELYNPSYKTPDGGYCWTKGGRRIKPAWVSTTVTFNFLKPSKLYTAIFYNVFGNDKREVHRYVFQTSRYANLADQITSYWIQDENKNQREAIFDIPVTVDTTILSQIGSLITNNKTGDSYLDSTFIDPFDSLIQGVLKLRPLPPALHTEINRVIDASGKLLGLLIRNTEPFLDPKLPDVEKKKFCKIIPINSTTSSLSTITNKCLYSKDCSQFFISGEADLEITSTSIRLEFNSIMWDGSAYVSDPNNQYITNTIKIN